MWRAVWLWITLKWNEQSGTGRRGWWRVWLLGRNSGEEPRGGKRGSNCFWVFWAVHFAGECVQMTNRWYFSGLNVSYNSWLMLPLAVTTAGLYSLWYAHSFSTAQTRDCLGQCILYPAEGDQSSLVLKPWWRLGLKTLEPSRGRHTWVSGVFLSGLESWTEICWGSGLGASWVVKSLMVKNNGAFESGRHGFEVLLRHLLTNVIYWLLWDPAFLFVKLE